MDDPARDLRKPNPQSTADPVSHVACHLFSMTAMSRAPERYQGTPGHDDC